MPFTGPGGSNPVDYVRRISVAAQPTEGDIKYALGRHAQRVQERTANGIDYQGSAFAPYSTRGPYYHDPSRESRFAGYTTLKMRRNVAQHHARFYGGVHKRGTTTVKYESYAAFKAARGVGAVDLGGMEGSLLPAIRIRVGDEMGVDEAANVGLESFPQPASEGSFGIYDEPMARIAEGHNNGIPGRLPQRMFIGVSDEDAARIVSDINLRILERLEQINANK